MQGRRQGVVRHVADGDGGLLKYGSEILPFRLWAIDAPELGQHYFHQARAALSELVHHELVEFESMSMDTYGRHIVRMFIIDGPDVGLEMVKLGLAWLVPRCRGDVVLYQSAFSVARARRSGLFIEENPVPPWVFRRRKPTRQQAAMAPLRRRQKA